MTARILEVCDGVVEAVTAHATANMLIVEASRKYLLPAELKNLTGRRVGVFPGEYLHSPSNRKEDQKDFQVALVVFEQCPDAGIPSNEWLDERVNYVNDLVTLLTNPRTTPTSLAGVWPQTARVTTYDLDELGRHVFWSELEITYREIAE